MPDFIDITGRRFGRWTVQNRAPNRTSSGRFALTYWVCRCTCGHVKEVRAASLMRGKSKSCGCFLQEYRLNEMTTHGEGGKNRISPEYRAWRNMLSRCQNPNIPGYRSYGGRGITVAKKWHSFESFLADMGRRPSEQHSLDRIDVNLGYFKANCRWTTSDIQRMNKRKSATIDQFSIVELKAELARRNQRR